MCVNQLKQCMQYYRINYVLLFLFFLTCNNLFAEIGKSNVYSFTHLNVTDGLSNNQVNAIFKDSEGFMWIGTMGGLNRYDGNSFRNFQNEVNDTTSIISNNIEEIYEDHINRIWINTFDGVNIYDPVKDVFIRNFNNELEKLSIYETEIYEIYFDSLKNLWVSGGNEIIYNYNHTKDTTITIDYAKYSIETKDWGPIASFSQNSKNQLWAISSNGVLICIDQNTNDIIYKNDYLYNRFNGKEYEYIVFIDDEDDIWVSIINDAHGIFYFDNKSRDYFHIHKDSEEVKLNNNIVKCIEQDQSGRIWIGTDHGGINIIDKSDFSVDYIMHNPYHKRSLSQNSVTCMFKDDTGIMWIGTYKQGVNYYHENIIRFNTIKNIPATEYSLSFDDINCFEEDKSGNLWIGTNGGGLKYYDLERGIIKQYVHDENDPNSIGSDVIVSLYIDEEDKLWVGTFHGGLNYFDGEKFYQYKTSAQPYSISSNHIWDITSDSNNNLWLATLGGGVNMFDKNREKFFHYKSGDVNSVSSNFIMSLTLDSESNMWIATPDGLDFWDKQSGRFFHYTQKHDDPNSISHNHVNEIYEDSRGNIWVGTGNGLNLYDKNNDDFMVFRTNDGLPHNTIHSIVEDNNNNLWVGTLGGLCNIIVNKNNDNIDFEFKNYDESDGLQGREFNLGAAYCMRNGNLVFGGPGGFNLFCPDDIYHNTQIPDVVFTNFQILNNNVSVGEIINGRVILEKSITKTDEIVLKHKENMFSIEFAALSYFHPEKNKYKYKLDGFNEDWLSADVPKVTYTNLNPGEYTFRVIASNNDGYWNYEGAGIKIVVLPPFWQSNIAMALYILIIAGALVGLRFIVVERARLKFESEQERIEAKRLKELDKLKTKFFTNISHDFKTPLTLIINPLDKIIKEVKDDNYKKQLSLVYRNAKRLLNLVSQLLDFRRMEVQELKLNPSMGDIVQFTRDVCYSFSDLSEKKDINLTFNSNVERLEAYFDHDKYERILINLLSNSFKFTPEQGSVKVDIIAPEENKKSENFESDKQHINIIVRDTGLGISSNKQKKIFERFYQDQLPPDMLDSGTGIGLSLVNEYVKLHGGSIQLESKQGEGSCFTIIIPWINDPGLLKVDEEKDIENEKILETDNGISKKKKVPLLLIVEDNEDFRFYLKDNLKKSYNIIEASNGKQGWKVTLSNIPDLVVSDVMMPVMDGIELAKKIKSDQRTSHIPLILLTAKNSEESKLEGFEKGADEYIAKPFSFKILESRIRNLITQRELLRSSFNNQIDIKPSEISVTSLDEKLIEKAIKLVENNISNSGFSVEEMSKEIGMSRVHLYKKLISLTGKAPIEFIRIIRLKRAAQLLKESQLTVSEVAYEVGFNNPKYFTKYFKAEFNILPSQFVAENKKNKHTG